MLRAIFLLGVVSAAQAAPRLHLDNAAVVLQIAPGANPAPQTIYAFNIGDGALSLSASVPGDAPWLTASVGAPISCNMPAGSVPCIPVQIGFVTPRFGNGTHTAPVTISSPGAIDAPQVVTVTVQVGAQPAAIDRYVAPGSFTDIPLTAGPSGYCFSYQCPPTPAATTQDGGNWLSVRLGLQGTFRSYGNYTIQLGPAATMPLGTYYGTVTPDSQAIPVTMRVTTQPIAVPSMARIDLRLAQDGPLVTYPFLPAISLSNTGLGTLAVQDVTASGTGVSAYRYADLGIVTIDPASLSPGIYNDGAVTIQCNAANCPIRIPVRLEIVPKGPPIVQYQSVVDNATFSPIRPVAPGGICILRGEQLSQKVPASADAAPLPTTLGGARVLVNGISAPLFYSSAGQIAFQMPSSIAPGTGRVQVERDGQLSNTVTVTVVPRAPGIVALTDTDYHVRNAAKPGDTLIVWAIGLGPTVPAVPDGAAAPADHLATLAGPPSVSLLGRNLVPSFAGLAPGSVGLYQVVVTLPADIQKGSGYLTLSFGELTSNDVPVAIQ